MQKKILSLSSKLYGNKSKLPTYQVMLQLCHYSAESKHGSILPLYKVRMYLCLLSPNYTSEDKTDQKQVL